MRQYRSTTLVVGAGLPGIVASYALAERGYQVVLLDSAPAVGGLLRSYQYDGFSYDYGTHFASRTGIPDLDNILFGGFESEWLEFPSLKAANFWNGVLNESSDNPDLNTLGQDCHNHCLAELLSAQGWMDEKAPDNARQYLQAEYGPLLIEKFFDPVFQKFIGRTSEQLHHQANQLFNLRRFAVLDPSATTELKSSKRFDAKVSFHHRDHFNGHRTSLYPRSGGIGRWIDQLRSKLEFAGVHIVTGSGVEHIELSGNQVSKVFSKGFVINPTNIFWSGAPAIFCKLAGIPLGCKQLEMRSTILVGLECDSPFLSDCQYCTVFDTSYEAFRITLYDNFRSSTEETGRYAASVEFMIEPSRISATNWVHLAEMEMRRMRLIDVNTRVLSRHQKVISNGFPIQTNEALKNLAEQGKLVGQFENVHLIGRASGESWFLNDLIKRTYALVVHAYNT